MIFEPFIIILWLWLIFHGESFIFNIENFQHLCFDISSQFHRHFSSMNHYLAQRLIISVEPEIMSGTPVKAPPIVIDGPLIGLDGKPIEKIADIINIGVQVLFPIAGILLFFFLVWGGYDFLLSEGDPEKIKVGKAKMTNAIIGFFLLVMSYFITKLISRIFGLGTTIF